MHRWMVNAWEVFNWWTGALVDRLIEESFRIEFFFPKKILVLLSASVERLGVSRMWDFHQLGRVGLVVTESVCVFVCLSPSHAIFFRPLIGPQIT